MVGPHDFAESTWGTGAFTLDNFLGWSDMMAHQDEHRELLGEAAYMRQKFLQGGELTVLQALKDWFVAHIVDSDKSLASHLGPYVECDPALGANACRATCPGARAAAIAGARARRKLGPGGPKGSAKVGAPEVAEVVSELADLPVERLLETDRERMLSLESLLAESQQLSEQIRALMQPVPPTKPDGPSHPGLSEEAASYAVLGVDVEFRRGFPSVGKTKFRHQADTEKYGALPEWATLEQLEWGTPTPIPKGQTPFCRFIGPAFRHLRHADGPHLPSLLEASTPWGLESLSVSVRDSNDVRALGELGHRQRGEGARIGQQQLGDALLGRRQRGDRGLDAVQHVAHCSSAQAKPSRATKALAAAGPHVPAAYGRGPVLSCAQASSTGSTQRQACSCSSLRTNRLSLPAIASSSRRS